MIETLGFHPNQMDDSPQKSLSLMLVLATTAHYGQVDKGGAPYIQHPMKVMHYLKTDDVELQCIAVGHDLLEDTKVTEQLLRELGFSERIIQGIRAMTKQTGQSSKQYQEQLFANVDAMRVKLADLRHNSDIRRLKGVTQKDLDRIGRYHQLYLSIQGRLRAHQGLDVNKTND